MKTIIGILVGVILAIVPLTLLGAEIPQELAASVKDAEEVGLVLFEASQQPQSIDKGDLSRARRQISDFCEFDYLPVRVLLGGKAVIFFLAQSTQPESIVFGRHYKVLGSSVTSSTKTCFVSPSPPPNVVGAYITHLLSLAPSEFHVYLSLIHQKPIFVMTSEGAWEVANGKVRFLEKM